MASYCANRLGICRKWERQVSRAGEVTSLSLDVPPGALDRQPARLAPVPPEPAHHEAHHEAVNPVYRPTCGLLLWDSADLGALAAHRVPRGSAMPPAAQPAGLVLAERAGWLLLFVFRCDGRFRPNMRFWLLLAVLACAGRAGAAPLSGNATREVFLGSERFLQASGVLLEGGACAIVGRPWRARRSPRRLSAHRLA